ncbi:MAG: ROK family protein [Bryobacteraceae bacterium]|jgi:glucokinase
MVLGIDVGGTRLKAGLVDETGAVLRSVAADTPAELEAFRTVVRQLAEHALDGASPLAVGFGCKGIVNPQTTRIECLPGAWKFLEGTLLSSTLEGLLPPATPVTADNDAKAALAGEMVWGAARGAKDALLLTLGTGVGGAILASGRILRGASGAAGHLGHINAEPDGMPCICGGRGCLETVFSARAIESEAWAAVHQGVSSPFIDAVREGRSEFRCESIFEAAAQGDPIAAWIVERRVHKLAAAVAGLFHAFDPELLILTGSVASAGEALLAPLRTELAWRTRVMLRREIPIVMAGVGDNSGVVGAAALGRLLLG